MSAAKKLPYKVVAAIIAKRKAATATDKSKPTARRRPAKQAAKDVVMTKPAVFQGTLSDIAEVKGRNGTFFRAQFVMASGNDFTSVTALISEKSATEIGDALKDGFIKLYGALQGDTLRVLGLGRDRELRIRETPALVQGPDAEYGYQYGAYFPN